MLNKEEQIKKILSRKIFDGGVLKINYKNSIYEDLINNKNDYFSIGFKQGVPITFSPSQLVEIWNNYNEVLNEEISYYNIALNNGYFFIENGVGFYTQEDIMVLGSNTKHSSNMYKFLSSLKDILVIGEYIEEPTIESLANDIKELKKSMEDLQTICTQIQNKL